MYFVNDRLLVWVWVRFIEIPCMTTSRSAMTRCFWEFDIDAIRKGVEIFPGLGGKLRFYYICIIKSYCSFPPPTPASGG